MGIINTIRGWEPDSLEDVETNVLKAKPAPLRGTTREARGKNADVGEVDDYGISCVVDHEVVGPIVRLAKDHGLERQTHNSLSTSREFQELVMINLVLLLSLYLSPNREEL